ncbi:MAG: heavy metal-binding domain-containing protein [bacterium]
MVTTGLSGNEIYCLRKLGYAPGEIIVGNSIWSLGFLGSLTSGIRNLTGGEIPEITSLVYQGRANAIYRLEYEAQQKKERGALSIRSDFIHHLGTGNIEFLSVGSGVHSHESAENDQFTFSSSLDGDEMYCNHDAGYDSRRFVFGNVAYAAGLGRNILGTFKTLARGEIKEFSDIYNKTRHIALQRIIDEAKKNNANSVLNIKTKVMNYSPGISEMIMIGTASYNNSLPQEFIQNPVTSDLTSTELWSITNMGMIPMKLLMGTSVYSLGITGSISSFFKSFTRGEIPELTSLIYEAREKSLGLINAEGNAIGADDVIGTKVYMYELGGGLIEFLAIGTAIKKVDFVKTNTEQLIPQAFIEDRDSFFDWHGLTLGNVSEPSV